MNGILLTRNLDLYSNNAFLQAAESLSLNLQVISFLDCTLQEDKVYYHNQLVKADFIISRIGVLDSDFGLSIYNILIRDTKLFLNSVDSIKNCKNKMLTYEILSKSNIPQPRTHFVFDESQLNDAIGEFQSTVVIKPLDGMKGYGVEKLHIIKDRERIINSIESNTCILIQEYLECNNSDIRVVVLDGRVIASLARHNSNDFRSNINCGGVAFPITIDETLIKLALKVSMALNTKFVALDFILCRGNYYLIEANDCPGFESINKVMQSNICVKVLEYLKRLSDD